MSKIITITFSPCVDKSATVKTLVPEKKMRCSFPKAEPGGGGINVARALHILDSDVTAVFPSGGHTGIHLAQLLQTEQLPFITIPSRNETRENFAIFDKENQKQYRFGMPSNQLFEDEWFKCLKVIEEYESVDFIVASGSLPKGVPTEVYAQLSKIADKVNAKFIIDASGLALKKAIQEKVFLLKPNIEELGILTGNNNLKINDVEATAEKLIKSNHCEIIVTSLGAEGAIMVTKEKTYTLKPPKVIVKSTIGAGDCMVAGLVFGLAKGESYEKVLRYGIACGTAATMNLGSELCKKKDVEMLLKIMKRV